MLMGKNRSFYRHSEGRLPAEGPQNQKERNSAGSSFSTLVHYLNTECVADREMILKRALQQKKGTSHSSRQKANKNRNYHKEEKPKTFEERLDLTIFWLEETFPKLFAADEYIPLDICILGDLKKDYKKRCFKKVCPTGLAIDAALAFYKKSYGYLECLQEGAVRYNLKGEPSGIVTKEEYEAARKILKTL